MRWHGRTETDSVAAMSEKEIKSLWAALDSLYAAGFSAAELEAKGQRIGWTAPE